MPTSDEIDRGVQAIAAAYAAVEILSALSMATEGHLRGRICTASNILNHALGRQQSVHGEQAHASDCARHNEPAERAGPCDCGAKV